MTYRVSGKQAVLGHAPGTTFEADLGEVQEARLLAGGALERVTEQATTAGKPEGTPPEPATEE